MMSQRLDTPFVYSSITGRIIGVRNSDGSVTRFNFQSNEGRYRDRQSPFVRIRNAQVSDLSVYDERTFRQVWQTPFVGMCNVRANFDTRDTAAGVWSSIAIAAGRNISEINPLDGAGVAATPEVFSNTAYTAADSGWATNGQVGRGQTGWSQQNIPAPTDGVGGGYVYTSVYNTVAAGRFAMVGNAARPSNDWQTYINPVLPFLKYRATYGGGSVDNVTTNHGSYTVNTDNSQFNVISDIDVIPAASAIFGVAIGDSKIQCLGTGTPAEQWNNYSFPLVACNMFNAAGFRMCVANYGFEGRVAAYYLKRWELLLADADFAPDFILVQPISINGGGYDAATINAAIKESLRLAAISRSRGTTVIFSGAAPDGGSSEAQDNLRKACNAALAQSGYAYFDAELGLTNYASPARLNAAYTYDGTHYNRAAIDQILAPRLFNTIGNALNL